MDRYALSEDSTRDFLEDFRQQVEEMTQSLTINDIAPTDDSVQNLSRNSIAPFASNAGLNTSTAESKEHDSDAPDTNMNKQDDLAVNKNNTPESIPDSSIKGITPKDTTDNKRNLRPLELAMNLNNISFDKKDSKNEDVNRPGEVEKVEKIVPHLERVKTPAQDLLEWCQDVTRDYKSCSVTNLTTSFSSGLAFCAIIHRFRPDLIDFWRLQPDTPEHNVRAALEASAALGIPQVLSVTDVCSPPAPDRLVIMTYLFQLRAHFTGSELQVEQLADNDETESSYLVGRHNTDGSLAPDLFSREVITRRSRRMERRKPPVVQESPDSQQQQDFQQSEDSQQLQDSQQPQDSQLSQHNLSNLSQDNDTKSPAQMTIDLIKTRIERRDPESSRTEKCLCTPELPKVSAPELLSRHEELKERARLLLEQARREAKEKDKIRHQKEKSVTEEERQAILRERARKLIADARAGIISPTSPLSPSRSPRGTVEIISKRSVMEQIAKEDRTEEDNRSTEEDNRSTEEDNLSTKSESLSNDQTPNLSPTKSFMAMLDEQSPDKDNVDEGPEKGSYIQSELEALEREQKTINETAASLEKQLRAVMESSDNTEEEDQLMLQWFNLVNKKNALIRRQMQLNILEQEEDLSRRCDLLARELRLCLGVEEWRKTPGQKRREQLLLQELIAAVNERDRLVQVQDEQEKAIEDDAEIEHNLSQVDFQRKNNCVLQ